MTKPVNNNPNTNPKTGMTKNGNRFFLYRYVVFFPVIYEWYHVLRWFSKSFLLFLWLNEYNTKDTCRNGETGIHVRFRCVCPKGVEVRVLFAAPYRTFYKVLWIRLI